MRQIVVLAAALACFSACKKSVEAQSARYDKSKQQLSELKALYPGFAGLIDSRLAAGEKLAEEAVGLSDEEAAADKFSAANKKLTGGFVTDLLKIEAKVSGLKEKMVDATAASAGKALSEAAKLASAQATKTLSSVEATLKAGAKEEAAAKAIVGKALRDLTSAEKGLGKVTTAAASKKSEEKTKSTEAKAEKAEQKAAKANWTCEYCTASNKHDSHKCDSCGAARAGAKPAK